MEAYEIDANEYHLEDEPFDYLIYDDGYIEQEPRWTRQRVIWFSIALIVILAMILLLIAPFLQMISPPVPSFIPPATPPSQL